MSDTDFSPQDPTRHHSSARIYEIRVQGHLHDGWSETLAGLEITREANGVTRLKGRLADQAAIHGLLKTLRDMALPLLSINPIAPSGPGESKEGDS